MTGSSLAPVIIPIVVSISLAAWLFIVYYANSHPQWKSARPAPGQVSPARGRETAGPTGAPAGLPGAGSDQREDEPRQRDLVSA